MNLHANVVAINLARCLYYARCERFSLESVMFDALPAQEKHGYVARASELLEALKDGPEPRAGDVASRVAFVTGLRGENKVIGAIGGPR